MLEQCALKPDLELFDAGDQTEVGEKGITLRYCILLRFIRLSLTNPLQRWPESEYSQQFDAM